MQRTKENLYTPILLRISKKIYRQYQRQLWDVSISEDIKDSFGSKTQNASELMLVANLQATRQDF